MGNRESKRTIVQRGRLQKQIERKDVLDYFLAGFTKTEIAERANCTVEAVNQILHELEHHVTAEIESIAEQLTLRNLARTERLIATHYIDAIEHNDRMATKTVLDLMKFESDLLDRLGIDRDTQEQRTRDGVVHIEEMHVTINAHSDLYKIANMEISDDWLNRVQPPVENLLISPEEDDSFTD